MEGDILINYNLVIDFVPDIKIRLTRELATPLCAYGCVCSWPVMASSLKSLVGVLGEAPDMGGLQLAMFASLDL
ncbi:hypothetical protein BDR03DRAFT_968180 [Suillus americanus]|nr:hypothetical protein BDR03DRAFT_968180 [Suillus americanus]